MIRLSGLKTCLQKSVQQRTCSENDALMVKNVEVSRQSGDTKVGIIWRELERSMQLICNVRNVLESFLDMRYVLSIESSLTTVDVLVQVLVYAKSHLRNNLLFDILAIVRESLTCMSRAVALYGDSRYKGNSALMSSSRIDEGTPIREDSCLSNTYTVHQILRHLCTSACGTCWLSMLVCMPCSRAMRSAWPIWNFISQATISTP